MCVLKRQIILTIETADKTNFWSRVGKSNKELLCREFEKERPLWHGKTSAIIYESQCVWCTSGHNTDGARTSEVGGGWCTDASSCGKTNTGIREMQKFADINYEFFF
jgi:hypothetical protein